MHAHTHPLTLGARRWLALTLAAALIAPALLTTLAASPAEATHLCAVYYNKDHRHRQVDGTGTAYYMGDWARKAPSGDHRCRDVNVSWTNLSRYHRGQYHNGSSWIWNASGRVWINAGTQSPWKVIMTSVATDTPVRVGNTTQHSSSTPSRSTWRI